MMRQHEECSSKNHYLLRYFKTQSESGKKNIKHQSYINKFVYIKENLHDEFIMKAH